MEDRFLTDAKRRSLLTVAFCLAFLRFLPLETSLHAQDDSTPQVTAIAVTPLVVSDGQSVAIGTFKIVRTGGTARRLFVMFQLVPKTTTGLSGRSKIMTEAIQPGKSSAHIKIGFPVPTKTNPPLVFQKLKLVTPTDSSYAVPDSKAAKIFVSYQD